MNTEQLKTFLSLVETKNFSRTAENLIISQSTVSKRIQELEKETGQELFIRKHSGVQLTNAGKALLEYAEQIVNMEEKALSRINYSSQYSGHLVLGTVYAYYDMYLYQILQDFSEQYTDISTHVKFGHSGQILNEVKRALIDIAFTHHPLHNPEYVCRYVGKEDVILVTDAANTAYRGGIACEKIQELPLLDSNFLYVPTRRRLFPRCYQFQLEFDIAASTIPLLRGSKWYTFLARKQVETQLNSGELIEIPIFHYEIPPVQHYVIYRKESEQQMVVSKFLSFLFQRFDLA